MKRLVRQVFPHAYFHKYEEAMKKLSSLVTEVTQGFRDFEAIIWAELSADRIGGKAVQKVKGDERGDEDVDSPLVKLKKALDSVKRI